MHLGLVQLAEARGLMSGSVLSSSARTHQSFVEEPGFTEVPDEPSRKPGDDQDMQEQVTTLLRDALVKIMLATTRFRPRLRAPRKRPWLGS